MAFIHYILHKIWRLEIGMWPLSMGAGDVGHMRSASRPPRLLEAVQPWGVLTHRRMHF